MYNDVFLYEIIEDYKDAETQEEKDKIFNEFCDNLWRCDNRRKVYNKAIKFRVKENLKNTEIGKVFDAWTEVEYKAYKALVKDINWCTLIRQKINNIYTRYCDENVILNKDYMALLRTPQNLYFRWIKGEEMNVDELTDIIDKSISKAFELRDMYAKQKIKLSWNEYKTIIEEFLRRAFDNCKTIAEAEACGEWKVKFSMYDFTEDQYYIAYLCKSLSGEMKKWQKKYYGVRDHQKYKRCKECGKMIEITNKKDYSTLYCSDCKKEIIRKQTKERVQKHREKKCNAS